MSKHLKQVKRQLYRNLIAAYRGWWEWHKVIRGKGVTATTAVVLLPSCDRAINHLALLYLDDMLKSRKYKKAVILTHDPVLLKCAGLFSKNILHIVFFSRKKAEYLMQFYCLYEFDSRFIVAALDEPNGRNGSALLGKRGTTAEEIFVIGVYRIYPFQRPDPPVYDGDDPEIKAFLEGRPHES